MVPPASSTAPQASNSELSSPGASPEQTGRTSHINVETANKHLQDTLEEEKRHNSELKDRLRWMEKALRNKERAEEEVIEKLRT